VVLLTGGMMLAGGALPSIPFHEFIESIEKRSHQSGEAQVVPQAERPGATSDIMSLTEIHLLGPGPHLAQNPVMFISVDGYIPDDISANVSNVPQPTIRYYWRAQTFDVYSGHGWIARTAQVDEIPADQSLLSSLDTPAPAENYKLVTQHLTLARTGDGVVFTAGELVQLDQPALVLWNRSGGFIAARTDADIYTAGARMPSVSVEQLRSAGAVYPPAILHYPDLPDDLPLRVRNLALDLTVNQSTPYDKAAILEAYLRQFTYSLDVPGPPANRDAVDYFLFDLKQGFCDYSASAMVVMARAVGLPARLVVGYSSGVYDEVEEQFIVRANNAHAWAEIYFPNIGWVVFEPTPTQPLPNRPGQEVDSSQSINLPSPGQKTPFSIRLERFGLSRLLGALLVIVAILIFFLSLPFERWWLSLLSIDRALKYIYRRLYRRSHSLGIRPDPSRTPNDFSLALSTAMGRTVKKEKRVALVTSLRTDLLWLTDLYDQLLFSEQEPNEYDKREAIRAWVRLRHGLGKMRR